LLKYRARYLQRGLRELLDDSKGSLLVRQFYDHPLISGLFRGSYDPDALGNLPSYIPAHTFAAVLLDIARTSQRVVNTAPDGIPGLGLVDIPLLGRTHASSGMIVSEQKQPPDPLPAPDPSAILRHAILNADQLGEQPKRALLTLIDSAGGDVTEAIGKIERWYDSAMDRVSGWYKRHVQWMLLVLGLAIATLFNADTVAIFCSLANDPVQRGVLLDAARAYATTPLSAPHPIAEITVPGASTNGAPQASCSYPAGSAECRIEDTMKKVGVLGIPLGWRTDDARLYPGDSVWNWVWKVIGIAVTGIAITLGAPFWFDILSRFMMARTTAKPQP
jgi:hypothetical protein